MPIEPEPAPMSHSVSPGRGRQRGERQRADRALGDLAVMLEPARPAARTCAAATAPSPRDVDPDRDGMRDIVEHRASAAAMSRTRSRGPPSASRMCRRDGAEAEVGEIPCQVRQPPRRRAPARSRGARCEMRAQPRRTARRAGRGSWSSSIGQPSRAAASAKVEGAGCATHSPGSRWRVIDRTRAEPERIARHEHHDALARAARAAAGSRPRTGPARVRPRCQDPGSSARWRAAPVTSSAAPMRPCAARTGHPRRLRRSRRSSASGVSAMPNILVLGGTTEASALAAALAARGTRRGAELCRPRRRTRRRSRSRCAIGGFGGVDGLVDYLREHGVTHLVDATHPFAARMSANAVAAAARAGVAHIALTRPAWQPVAGDRWTRVADIDAAVAALAGPPRRVMLASGGCMSTPSPRSRSIDYLLRFVDRAATSRRRCRAIISWSIADRSMSTGDRQLMRGARRSTSWSARTPAARARRPS